MEASVFDSNKYANRLVATGVSPENANLQAEAIGEVMQAVVALDAKVERYHAELLVAIADVRAQIAESEKRLMRWVLAVGGALGILQGVLAFIARL